MGYPKKHRGRRKIGSKKRRARKRNKRKQRIHIMEIINQIRKLSLLIFIIPFIAINLCLIVSQNPEFLENTIFTVDQIGRSGFSIPYFDGSLSISRAARTFPQYLIFKPAMFITAFLLYLYWSKNNQLVNNLKSTNLKMKALS